VHHTIAILLGVRHAELVSAALAEFVSQRTIRNERRMIVAKLRVHHSQGLKDIFRREIFQSFATQPLHNQVRAVGSPNRYISSRYREKIEAFLPDNNPQRIIIGRHIVIMDARKKKQRLVIAKAVRVVQQVEYGDLLSPLRIIRQLRNVLSDVVIEPQLALFFEKKNARGCELLRHRANVEHGLWTNAYVLFDVRQPIPFGVDNLAVSIDPGRAAR